MRSIRFFYKKYSLFCPKCERDDHLDYKNGDTSTIHCSMCKQDYHIDYLIMYPNTYSICTEMK